jgi:hypothetical protein
MGILEKRVRSRCQSQVHQVVLGNSWDDYLALASSLLRADEIAWREESEEQGDLAEEWNEEVEVSPTSECDGLGLMRRGQAFLEEEDVVEYLERLWRIHGNTPTQLRQALVRPIHSHMQQPLTFLLRSWSCTTPSTGSLDTPGLSSPHPLPPPYVSPALLSPCSHLHQLQGNETTSSPVRLHPSPPIRSSN